VHTDDHSHATSVVLCRRESMIQYMLYHGLCDNNKLLYKRCAKSMGKPKIRPPTAPIFSTDLSETRNQERYPGYDPACRIWLMWDDRKGVCENGEFWPTFGSFFFVLFASPPDHTVGPITTNEGSKRVFLRKEVPFGVSMIKSKV